MHVKSLIDASLLDYLQFRSFFFVNDRKMYDQVIIISTRDRFNVFYVILFEALTSLFQMTNTIQKKFKVSSTQLLYQSCPYQAGTLLISGPFLDWFLTNQNVFDFNYTTQVLVRTEIISLLTSYFYLFSFNVPLIQLAFDHLQVFIILSCLISVSVNFSTFLVIGKTSPVTYQVLGHLKTCLVLAFGYILLHDPFNWRNILGILIALVGMVLYSYFCTLESQKKVTETALPSFQVMVYFHKLPFLLPISQYFDNPV